ncbi:hypothetical protein [Shewanella sp. KX20019]|uniref:hypothetical protein n=1 Tax=Shewanella sp. KX20019 TaxID=2803864 RepID=UPI001F469045|nr:hypothetical protein [Shewanella sp. KX20019]
MQKNVINYLKMLHWVGLSMLLCGVGLFFFTEMAQQVTGMMLIACLAGLGMVMMSPFPIALFLQWARDQTPDQ